MNDERMVEAISKLIESNADAMDLIGKVTDNMKLMAKKINSMDFELRIVRALNVMLCKQSGMSQDEFGKMVSAACDFAEGEDEMLAKAMAGELDPKVQAEVNDIISKMMRGDNSVQ